MQRRLRRRTAEPDNLSGTFGLPNGPLYTFELANGLGFITSFFPQDSPNDTYVWSATGGFSIDESIVDISILDQTNGQLKAVTLPGGLGDGGPTEENGTLSFSPVSASTPEPLPAILIFLGAGLIFFMRKRFVTCIPREA